MHNITVTIINYIFSVYYKTLTIYITHLVIVIALKKKPKLHLIY